MEIRLKERLVGAIVLVAIVVVVVPELLTGPRGGDTARTETTPGAVAPVRTVTIDLGTASRVPEARSPDAAPTPAATTPIPATAPVATPLPATAPPPPTSAAAADASSRAVPREPVLSTPPQEKPAVVAKAPAPSTDGAATIRPDASSAAKTPVAKTPDAAPAAKPAAPKAAIRTPESEPAAKPAVAATKPTSSGASGWVVQLGSFASRPNAEKLVGELRRGGYSAFVSEFRGSGKVLYRVRVGPEQDRARADALAKRLARDGRKGSVTPHP